MPVVEDAFFYRYRTLTLEELAAVLHLSVRQTQRLLQRNFGKTFSQKLNEARIAAAAQFLLNTGLSVTEIGERTGFSSIEHFSSSFRRFTGFSPTQYRKNHP
jgi:AraC-like DNA-binding protein